MNNYFSGTTSWEITARSAGRLAATARKSSARSSDAASSAPQRGVCHDGPVTPRHLAIAVAKPWQDVEGLRRKSHRFNRLGATPAGFESLRRSASPHETPHLSREKPDSDRVSLGLMGSRGSKVARLAALAANAVWACDLVRALAVLDEIQDVCRESPARLAVLANRD